MELSLNLNHEDSTRLRKRAEVEGVSELTLALTALRQFLDAVPAPMPEAAGPVAEVKQRYAASLRRPGERG